MKKGKKQIKKSSGVAEVTDKEIADLEKELAKLPDRDTPPKQPENYGLKMKYAYKSLVLLSNEKGIFYSIESGIKTFQLKKLVVV